MPVFRTNDYGGNGLASGLSQGMALAQMLDEKKRRQGLASGVAKLQSGDETGWQEIAQNDPNYYLNYKAEQEKLANELEKQRIQRTFNKTNEMKNTEYLISLGYSPEEAIKKSYRQQNPSLDLNPFERKRIENMATKMDENIKNAQNRLSQYDRAGQLLDKINTGGFSSLVTEMKPERFRTPEQTEFIALANELTPSKRPVGAGSTSDKDMEIYKSATFGIGKDKKANKSIITMGRAMAENDLAHEEIRADWISNGGSIADFDKAWRKYVNEQRIYNDDGSINTKRISPYEYFGGGNMGNAQTETNIPSGGSINGFKIERIE